VLGVGTADPTADPWFFLDINPESRGCTRSKLPGAQPCTKRPKFGGGPPDGVGLANTFNRAFKVTSGALLLPRAFSAEAGRSL
jgi:hypothetical protein